MLLNFKPEKKARAKESEEAEEECKPCICRCGGGGLVGWKYSIEALEVVVCKGAQRQEWRRTVWRCAGGEFGDVEEVECGGGRLHSGSGGVRVVGYQVWR